MIFHTGSSKSAWLLLFCVGIWLSTCRLSFSIPALRDINMILGCLTYESKEIYDNYMKEEHWPEHQKNYSYLQLPCFTLGPEASKNISVIQAYLETVKTVSSDRVETRNLIKRLDDISYHNLTKPNISETITFKNKYQHKQFIVTVLKQFSSCMKDLKILGRKC
ncbi:interleukin-31-like [Nannospalax galili]|uniref:interleukin-31-like n=1 Tax=Nannospalax galili TaxID=1026970 RepID=UPI0004ED69F1|nr:interleukin-31-like [Nannospalax galili]